MQGSKQQSTGGFTTQCFITGLSVGGEGGELNGLLRSVSNSTLFSLYQTGERREKRKVKKKVKLPNLRMQQGHD